ncbi:hypothetical protein IHE44_0008961 [Lamprotornis superbus]|uniref:CNIH4 n=11 Tax=Neoaves TaxID=3078114 RepID=A0A835TXQ0_9PASS|nr:hypothetical protein IHE44_0008961 [Lamprotornis superbus]
MESIITLSDLECDYINARSCCSKLNKWVVPEVIGHAVVTVLMLISLHWFIFLLNLPVATWNIYRYIMVPSGNMGVFDPTEIHNRGQLKSHMKEAMIKLGFHLLCFFMYLYSSTNTTFPPKVAKGNPVPSHNGFVCNAEAEMPGAGPHILTVPSSEALAIMAGICGFQLTQFTVRVCPVSSAMGSSLRLCQIHHLLVHSRAKAQNNHLGHRQQVLINRALLDSKEKDQRKSDMKDCFLGSAARDLVTLSQPAALGVLLARKSKFLKRKHRSRWSSTAWRSRFCKRLGGSITDGVRLLAKTRVQHKSREAFTI